MSRCPYRRTVPTVTDDGMRDYLEAFHRTYRLAVEEKVPADLRSALARAERLSDGVIGYISTQFGAGFEYVSDAGVAIRKGSRRVEDLLFDAPASIRKSGPMMSIGGSNCGIGRLTLEGAFPVRLTEENASVRLWEMRAKAGHWVRDVEWAELFGSRTDSFWSVEMATHRALEEILGAVVDAREMERRQLDLGEFLDRFRQRRVLLLGDFQTGRDRLAEVGTELEQLGYLPIFADDIPDVREHDLRQKVLLLALTCRFIVIEDSSPAGQLAEVPIVEMARAVAIVLRRRGSHSSWMTVGPSHTSSVIQEVEYDDTSLRTVISDGTQWAETQLERLGRTFDERLPWRHPPP